MSPLFELISLLEIHLGRRLFLRGGIGLPSGLGVLVDVLIGRYYRKGGTLLSRCRGL